MAGKAKEYATNASIVKRILAFIIDIFLLNFFVLNPFRSFFAGSISSSDFRATYETLVNDETVFNAVYAGSIFMGIIILLYFAIAEWKLGQSIGKIVLGIYVVPEDYGNGRKGNKTEIAFWQALLRSAYALPVFPFFLLAIIDPIYMFFNAKNQRLSERFSRTMVVEKYRFM